MELKAVQLSKEYRKGKRALDAFSYTFHEGIYNCSYYYYEIESPKVAF